MNPINDQQLDEIEQSANAATPGPWTAESSIPYGHRVGSSDEADWVAWTGEHGETGSEADATYIATMHPEVAKALIDEVRRLRADRNRYRNAWHNARARAADGWADAKLAETRADDLDAARRADTDRIAELEPYEMLTPQQCPAGKHADWLVDSEYAHACPWCQIEELRAESRPAVRPAVETGA